MEETSKIPKIDPKELIPVMNVDEADELLQRLISSGHTDARLVLE